MVILNIGFGKTSFSFFRMNSIIDRYFSSKIIDFEIIKVDFIEVGIHFVIISCFSIDVRNYYMIFSYIYLEIIIKIDLVIYYLLEKSCSVVSIIN